MLFVCRSLSRRAAVVTLGALIVCGAVVQPTQAQTSSPTAQVEALIGDSVSNASDPRYSDVGEALKRFANRDQLSARTFLERAVEKNPKLPPVGVLMAKLQLLTGNRNGLRPALERAVQEDSGGDPEPYLLLAEQALAGQRTIEAEALYDKAVELIDAYNANAKRKRQFQIRAFKGAAVIAERRENWTKAEENLRKWIEQEPEEASAFQRLGQVLFMFESDDRDGAGYNAFVKAKGLNDELPSPYVSAALMYSRRGDTSRAMEAFDRAFRESGNDATTLVSYAQALLQAGDVAKAETVLEKARSVAADQQSVWLLSGVAARMAGDTATAQQHLLQGLNLQPSNREALNQLALVLIESDDAATKQRGLQYATINQKLNPDADTVNVTLAWVLYQSGRSRQATQILQQVLTNASLDADSKYLVARILAEGNNTKNARLLLESALADTRGIFVQRKAAEELLASL